jgi:hypothetical protein
MTSENREEAVELLYAATTNLEAAESLLDPNDSVTAQQIDAIARQLDEVIAELLPADEPEPAPEVCPDCLGRTGGVAEPPAGQCFMLELKREVKVGGVTWPANSEGGELLNVARSPLAPYHFVAYYGDNPPPRSCSPVCKLPADAIEIWMADEGQDD